jgi:hypothetical protein
LTAHAIWGLAGLCCVLALGIVAELLPAAGTTPLLSMSPPPLADLEPSENFTPISMAALTERPLYNTSRRPSPSEPVAVVSPAPAPVAPPPEPATQLTLLGIVRSPTTSIALIRVGTSQTPLRLAEGATVDRWKIRRIAADHVTLESGGIEQDLGFQKAGSRSAHSPTPTIKH